MGHKYININIYIKIFISTLAIKILLNTGAQGKP